MKVESIDFYRLLIHQRLHQHQHCIITLWRLVFLFSVLVSIAPFRIENVSQQQKIHIYFHKQTTRLQSAAVCSWRQTECIMWHNAGKRPRVSWLWCLHHAASPVPGTVFTLLTRRDIRTWPSLHTAATLNLYTDWLTTFPPLHCCTGTAPLQCLISGC